MTGVPFTIVIAFVVVAAVALVWALRAEHIRSRLERRAADVTAREAAFVTILQRLAVAHRLEDVLDEVVLAIERIIPGATGSILLIEEGVIRHGAAPGLPNFYNEAVDGMPVGEGVGSCGSAAAMRRPVIVADVSTHPYWAPYAELARRAGFAACWSHPVIEPDGTVIATFATYYKEKREPDGDELATIRAFAEILRLAIGQFRNRQDLLHAKDAAQAASRAKSRFLSMMSHELRTPLNAIIGFSDVMRLELFGPRDLPVYKDYAENIHRSGRHLLELVNQILDVSRIESGMLDLRIENVPLHPALSDVLRMESGTIAAKSLQLNIFDDTALTVRADRQSLRQLFLNIVDNAIKYSPNSGAIEIEATRDGHWVNFEVRDQGPGVPPDKVSQLGTPFVSFADPQMVDSKQSIGLGLSVSRALVEAMEGEIRFDNLADGGFRVKISLPAGGEVHWAQGS
jgi:two-component system cell cycle sensor histidine kinase PleC